MSLSKGIALSFFQMPGRIAARRMFLGQPGLVLIGAAVPLLAENEALAADQETLMKSAYTPGTAPIQTSASAAHREPKQPGRRASRSVMVLGAIGAAGALVSACGGDSDNSAAEQAALVAQGKQIFRFDTFGDETQWTDTLRMHEVIRTAVDPTTALAVGLKVDAEALPAAVVAGIQNGTVDLKSPDTTVALLKLNAVVGLKGTVETVNGKDMLTRVGVTCALCHSTVDNSFAPGIGKRLDGWPNRDLDSGAIIALSPALSAAVKAVYNSWGPGKYDPRFNLDGKNGPQVIPPAYGLAGINKIISTGDGDDLAYWNRYVGVTQMGGHGSFAEPRTGVNVSNGTDDLITAKLPALQAFQLSLAAPPPPAGSFDPVAAERGKLVFNNSGKCVSCHSGLEFTDANSRLHPPSDAVSEPEPNGAPSYASRSATKQYRTAPLKGLWQHAPYFHNGTAPTLDALVQTYNTKQSLGLTATQISDLAQYLKSL